MFCVNFQLFANILVASWHYVKKVESKDLILRIGILQSISILSASTLRGKYEKNSDAAMISFLFLLAAIICVMFLLFFFSCSSFDLKINTICFFYYFKIKFDENLTFTMMCEHEK
jgi:hypothetical protein